MDDDQMMGNYGVEEELERQRRVAELAEGEAEDEDEDEDRVRLLTPVVQSLVAALGGWEDVDLESGETVRQYRPGDSVIGCLRDLKKLWRKDDSDDERTVARIFGRSGVARDLVALVEEVSERGDFGFKVGMLAADLLGAMTWPIDVAAELKELEDEPAVTTDYSSLLQAQLEYKAVILRSGVFLDKLMGLLVPCLAKVAGERQERDEKIISLILHIIRNLLSIRDAVGSNYASTDNLEKSTLQSTLILQLESSHFLPLIITLASSSQTRDFNPFNVLVLDILQLMLRGVPASELAKDRKTAARDSLSSLLEQENLVAQSKSRNSASRHSRFGTTVAVQFNGDSSRKMVVHRASAVKGDTTALMDKGKKRARGATKVRKNDDLSLVTNLLPEAMLVLQKFSTEFLEVAFNTFFASILKDIRMERPKVRETDNIRALYLATFFLEFFLLSRAQSIDPTGKGKAAASPSTWDFGYVAEFAEIDAVKWVVARMRLVMDDKPPGWTELQAGIGCFTQILLLIDAMAASGEEEPLEAAEILQNQIYYNGDILDLSHDLVAKFKDQSIAYLDGVVHLAYVLLRMLEKYSKSNTYMYIRKRKAKRAKRRRVQRGTEEENDDEDEEAPDADEGAPRYAEHAFAFEKFEQRFAHEDVLRTLLTYLERYSEFSSTDKMKRVVGLLHRIAVKVKAEGLFFKVSVLELFRRILDDQLALPKDPSSRDLIGLVNFVLKKFFKAAQDQPFLLVEAFFPKNRDQWKKFSSWAPEEGEGSSGEDGESRAKKVKIPADVQIIDKNLTHSQEIGIAVAALLEASKVALVTWAVEILRDAAAARQEIILNTDGLPEPPDLDQTDEEIRAKSIAARKVSEDALAKFTDFEIPFSTEERSNAASLDPHLKLLFRLFSFETPKDDEVPMKWNVPALILPDELEDNANIVEQFIREPLDLNGDPATDKLKRKQRARKKRVRRPVSDDEGGELPDEPPRERKKKKEKENLKYKSAALIEDSDDDADDEAFFAAEKALMERLTAEAALGTSNMLKTGSKKRKSAKETGKKARRAAPMSSQAPPSSQAAGALSSSPDRSQSARRSSVASSHDGSEMSAEEAPAPRARPKPQARRRKAPSLPPDDIIDDDDDAGDQASGRGGSDMDDDEGPAPKARPKPQPRRKALSPPPEEAEDDAEDEPMIAGGDESGKDNDEEEEDEMASASLRKGPKKRVQVFSDDDE